MLILSVTYMFNQSVIFVFNALMITVMILSFRTPKTFVVITLKFELCGFTIH